MATSELSTTMQELLRCMHELWCGCAQCTIIVRCMGSSTADMWLCHTPGLLLCTCVPGAALGQPALNCGCLPNRPPTCVTCTTPTLPCILPSVSTPPRMPGCTLVVCTVPAMLHLMVVYNPCVHKCRLQEQLPSLLRLYHHQAAGGGLGAPMRVVTRLLPAGVYHQSYVHCVAATGQ